MTGRCSLSTGVHGHTFEPTNRMVSRDREVGSALRKQPDPVARTHMEGTDVTNLPDPYDSRDVEARLDSAARLLRRALMGDVPTFRSIEAALDCVDQARFLVAIGGVSGLD